MVCNSKDLWILRRARLLEQDFLNTKYSLGGYTAVVIVCDTAGFRVVTQRSSQRCVATLKTAV